MLDQTPEAAQVMQTLESAIPDGGNRQARRGRLLIVDDEPGILRVLRLLLGRHHDLFTESSAEAALQRIFAGERFDLILSDLTMPGMTGIELLTELTHVAPSQAERLVFLTGGAATVEARAFLSTTAHRLIEKPFDTDAMLAFISSSMPRDVAAL